MDLGIQKITERIAEFFTIFDFSFFISGITTFAAICYGLWETYLFYPFESTFSNVAGCVVASYVCGLVSFAGGKYLRGKWIENQKIDKKSRFMYFFTNALIYVEDSFREKIKDYENKEKDEQIALETFCKTYYTEMWMNLRQNEKAKDTLAFLNKYWVFQAIYEGLMSSCLVGIAVGVILSIVNGLSWVYVIIIAVCILSFFICRKEATRYAETQIKEVVIADFNLK